MKVVFKASDLFTVEAEGTTHTEVFTNLAGLAEVFSIGSCGACKSKDIVPIRRVVDDTPHYEVKCKGCGARLTMAQNKKGGTLYPRRRYNEKQSEVKAGKAVAGEWIPNGGWEQWTNERNDEAEETSLPPPTQTRKGR